MDEISRLKSVVQDIESKSQIDDGTWLDHLNPSQAFLVCIGAGPWKINRRNLIQQGAVEALGAKDLAEVTDVNIFKFPLDWQVQKTADMIDYLQRYKITMRWFAGWVAGFPNPIKMIYDITKTRGRAKVLDLYARDYLKVPSFPIDRHVERILKENGFPVNEKYMIDLCNQAGLNVSHVARVFVAGTGKFTGNGEIKAS